jgi:hypothetical protein
MKAAILNPQSLGVNTDLPNRIAQLLILGRSSCLIIHVRSVWAGMTCLRWQDGKPSSRPQLRPNNLDGQCLRHVAGLTEAH